MLIPPLISHIWCDVALDAWSHLPWNLHSYCKELQNELYSLYSANSRTESWSVNGLKEFCSSSSWTANVFQNGDKNMLAIRNLRIWVAELEGISTVGDLACKLMVFGGETKEFIRRKHPELSNDYLLYGPLTTCAYFTTDVHSRPLLEFFLLFLLFHFPPNNFLQVLSISIWAVPSFFFLLAYFQTFPNASLFDPL